MALNLDALGRLNTTDLVDDFVKKQKSYADYYAQLGDPETLAKKQRVVPPDTNALLTPILKPRAPLPEPNQPQSPTKKISKKRKEKENKNTANSNTRGASEADQEEQERLMRLSDRRDRRREKHAILHDRQPEASDEASEPDDEGEAKRKDKQNSKSTKSTQKKRKIDVSEKPKVPLGLALMESFAAKNVKKDRLTLKPTSSFGVFSKGKASLKTRKSSGKGSSKRAGAIFSESRFLESKGLKEASIADASTSSSETEAVQFDFLKAKTSTYFKSDAYKKTQAEPPVKITGKSTGSKNKRGHPKSVCSQESGSSPRRSRASAVWDIEVDKPLPNDDESVVSNSRTSSSEPGEPASKPRVAKAPSDASKARTKATSAKCFTQSHASVERTPETVDTIRPSHSASQVCHGQSGRVESDHDPCDAELDVAMEHEEEAKTHPTRQSHSFFHRRFSPSLTELEFSLPQVTIPYPCSPIASSLLLDNAISEYPEQQLPIGTPSDAGMDVTDTFDYAVEGETYPGFSDTQPREGSEFLDEIEEALSTCYVELDDCDEEAENFEGHDDGFTDYYLHEEDLDTLDACAEESELGDFGLGSPDVADDSDGGYDSGGEIFAEGRALLYRLRSPGLPATYEDSRQLLQADLMEKEVAAKLKNHWRPLKF